LGLFGKSFTKFLFFFFFSQKYQIKNILTFLHFLHHINNFLLLFNQKNPLQNKTFSLFYKTFSNFLSHQSFLTTIQINIPIHNHNQINNISPFILMKRTERIVYEIFVTCTTTKKKSPLDIYMIVIFFLLLYISCSCDKIQYLTGPVKEKKNL
jgi:hypothetical protein